MGKAAKLLSLILAVSILLTTGVYASSGPDASPAPEEAGSTAAPESTVSPAPDPAPPAEAADDGEPALLDTADLAPAGYDTLTGHPGRETGVPITVGTEVRDRQDVTLNETVEGAGYTALYAAGTDADVHAAGAVRLADSAQDTDACFPSGRGAALVAHDGAALTAEDMQIETSGLMRPGLVVSDGASAAVRDSQLTVLGGGPLAGGEGYVNTPDLSAAYTAPWPLGVGGSGLAVGLVGSAPDLALIGTAVNAAGWGVLYAGQGEDAAVTAVDSTLAILPAGQGGMDPGEDLLGYDPDVYGSGYGLYSSGGTSAYLYGASITGATYGAVLDGAGESYIGPSDGTILLYEGDQLSGSVPGQGQASSIQSVFGFLMTGDAENVTVDDRTAVETADAVILYKDGDGSFTFHNARLQSDSGVLLQMMDSDDDDRIGLLSVVYGYSPVYDERNLSEAPEPRSVAPEADGGGTPDGASLPTAPFRSLSVTYTNGLYTGSLYNGTGYCGQPGDSLSVTVGRGAVLDGDVCLAASFKAIPYTPQAAQALEQCGDHVLYNFLDAAGSPCQEDQAAYIQLTRYTMEEYYLQGHVQDLPFYNGNARLNVTVAQGGAWAVRDTSLLTGLTVEDGAQVYGQIQDNHDGSLTLTPADEPLEPGVYVSEREEPAGAEEPAEALEEPAETPEEAPVFFEKTHHFPPGNP